MTITGAGTPLFWGETTVPKPTLVTEDARLESDAIETMLAGLKEWRPDLDYPESHSDMQACFRALLCVYEIKRRPLPRPLRVRCHVCEGLGELISLSEHGRRRASCPDCQGKGWKE